LDLVEDDGVFDYMFNQANGFEFSEGHKTLDFRNGIPFGQKTDNGESVRFHSLHFQGLSKRLTQKVLKDAAASRLGVTSK